MLNTISFIILLLAVGFLGYLIGWAKRNNEKNSYLAKQVKLYEELSKKCLNCVNYSLCLEMTGEIETKNTQLENMIPEMKIPDQILISGEEMWTERYQGIM